LSSIDKDDYSKNLKSYNVYMVRKDYRENIETDLFSGPDRPENNQGLALLGRMIARFLSDKARYNNTEKPVNAIQNCIVSPEPSIVSDLQGDQKKDGRNRTNSGNEGSNEF